LSLIHFQVWSQLPLRNCICSEIHHKLLPTSHWKVYCPDLATRSYWYPRYR